MAKKFDENIFNQASKQAMAKALDETLKERVQIMKDADFANIIVELKKSSVDKAEIDHFASMINQATDKNNALLQVLEKGTALAKVLIGIIK